MRNFIAEDLNDALRDRIRDIKKWWRERQLRKKNPPWLCPTIEESYARVVVTIKDTGRQGPSRWECRVWAKSKWPWQRVLQGALTPADLLHVPFAVRKASKKLAAMCVKHGRDPAERAQYAVMRQGLLEFVKEYKRLYGSLYCLQYVVEEIEEKKNPLDELFA